MSIRSWISQQKDLTIAERTNLQRSVLITVPHAFSGVLSPGHPRDFAAQTAAEELKDALEKQGVKKISMLIGNKDRTYEKDLNRGEWNSEEQLEKWIQKHPEGILLDVHSFPSRHIWRNSTVHWRQGDPERSRAPLVVLLPVKDRGFAYSFREYAQVYQGTSKNKIMNLGIERSVLLEFQEGRKEDWPIDSISDLIERAVNE